MFSTILSVPIVLGLLSFTKATELGSSWDSSLIGHNDDDPVSLLPSWPRTEPLSVVRSTSSATTLTPGERHHEVIDSDCQANNDEDKEISRTSEEYPQDEPIRGSMRRLRPNDKVEDEEKGKVFIRQHVFHDPIVGALFGNTKDVKDVEALPSLWQKMRSHDRALINHGRCSEVEEIDESYAHERSRNSEPLETEGRVRREADRPMDKIAASKNVREPRLSSPESWSTQPVSVQFRHRSNFEKIETDDETEKLAKSTGRIFQAPRADFVTANRRSSSGNRELSSGANRFFDETPMYVNSPEQRHRNHPYSRGLFYPERYRTERDYFVEPLNKLIYPHDRYRHAEYDRTGRSKASMPKPKRIIYYATLPEIVRKPIDFRSYSRPYNTNTEPSTDSMLHDGYEIRHGGSLDSATNRWYRHQHGSNYYNYAMYPKASSWTDAPYIFYPENILALRRRQQDTTHANIRTAFRNDDAILDLGDNGKLSYRVNSRDRQHIPWLANTGTKISVNEDFNEFPNNTPIDRVGDVTVSAETRE